MAKAKSPKVARARRYEQEFDLLTLDNLFIARDSRQLNELMWERVYAESRYTKLPQYRQIAIQAYARGAADALSRVRLEKRTTAAAQERVAAKRVASVRRSPMVSVPAGITPPPIDLSFPVVLSAAMSIND